MANQSNGYGTELASDEAYRTNVTRILISESRILPLCIASNRLITDNPFVWGRKNPISKVRLGNLDQNPIDTQKKSSVEYWEIPETCATQKTQNVIRKLLEFKCTNHRKNRDLNPFRYYYFTLGTWCFATLKWAGKVNKKNKFEDWSPEWYSRGELKERLSDFPS